MRYLGGKNRIGKEIAQVLQKIAPPDTVNGYCEPFCGSLGVMVHMVPAGYKKTLAYDKCKDIILLWKEIKKGTFKIPRNVSERTWKRYKARREPSAMRAFVGFGCSFGGKWFSGYANLYDSSCQISQTKRAIQKKVPMVCKINRIGYKDYRSIRLKGYLIYCDPPYQGTVRVGKLNSFDHVEFWNIMREWSKENIVIISEYNAPKDFKCIWKKKLFVQINKARHEEQKKKKTEEKLFIHKSVNVT